jgi:hypothetical protein
MRAKKTKISRRLGLTRGSCGKHQTSTLEQTYIHHPSDRRNAKDPHCTDDTTFDRYILLNSLAVNQLLIKLTYIPISTSATFSAICHSPAVSETTTIQPISRTNRSATFCFQYGLCYPSIPYLAPARWGLLSPVSYRKLQA